MKQMPISFTRSSPGIPAPRYAREGDAGMDLSSTIDYVLQPFERAVIPTGISLAIPEGYAGLVMPRSGLAAKYGISIVNAPGLIDSGYRGEIKVVLINLDPSKPFKINAGDRIAQIMFTPFASGVLHELEFLDETERGTQGFGSSGCN